jgi:glycosyltransferase involved in cell wall biosynthesis
MALTTGTKSDERRAAKDEDGISDVGYPRGISGVTNHAIPSQRRRLLLVTYHHPPIPFLGGARWSGLAKYLRALGHDLTIVTTGAHGHLPEDAEQEVARTLDLTSVAALRRILRRPPIAREGDAPPVSKRPSAILTRMIVPDTYLLSWAAWAVPTVRRLIHRRSIECVITTSPPDSTHLVGLARGRNGPAWMADFRDGWMFEGLREPFPTAPQRRLDAWLEAQVVRRADRVIAPTLPLIEDLRSRYGRDGGLVPNAWDTGLEADVARASAPTLGTDRVNLVYTGTLGGLRGHDDRGLLAALRRLVREEPAIATRLRLVIAGRLMEDEASVLGAPDLRPVVHVVGTLPRPAAVALQRQSDALLLVTSNHKSIVTGKLFEYLTAGRPILALAGDNEAARIVRETRTGEIAPPDDVDAIVQALRRVTERSLTYAPTGTERYTYEAVAQTLTDEIEAAIRRRASGASGHLRPDE